MTTCERCGIDFDQVGPLCRDCVDVLELDGVLAATPRPKRSARVGERVNSNRRGTLTEAQRARVEDEIRRLNAAGRSDPQIAIELGLSDRTIIRYRHRIGVPPVTAHAYTFHGAYRAPTLPREYRHLEVA